MKNRPIIGVLPLFDTERDSLWMLPGYMNGIENAGGIPIMLPLTDDIQVIKKLADMCSGFLFTGGHDVSPSLYGQKPYGKCIECFAPRDILEKELFTLALAENKSVLGICRGIQFINAYLGGTLYQHLPDENPSEIEHHQAPPYDLPSHSVKLIHNSPLESLLGCDMLDVNSYHHQAIKELAKSLEAMAYSPDGLVEAAYMQRKRFVWAVQWHPEFDFKTNENSRKIFSEFIKSI